MLGGLLAGLDVPSDGSCKLVSVNTSFDDNGCQQWTVVFRSTKPSAAGPITPHPKEPPTAPAPKASPGKSVGFAPEPHIMPAGLVPSPAPQKVMMDRIFPLKCQVKTYAWGKLGCDSLVGLLASEGLEELELTDNIPYAELWMGTHPSGPAMVMLSSPWRTVTPLSEWIKLNPSLLGPARPRVPPAWRRASPP